MEADVKRLASFYPAIGLLALLAAPGAANAHRQSGIRIHNDTANRLWATA